jgi:predicted nucleic acid-binding protein
VIVVDTNILAYRFLPNPKNDEIDALIRSDPDWAAPFLWRSELRSVLTGYLRKKLLDQDGAEAVMLQATRCLLAGEHFVEDTAVFDLVAASKCSAYDCEYVAVARALGAPLVTEDKALLAAFPKICRSLMAASQKA